MGGTVNCDHQVHRLLMPSTEHSSSVVNATLIQLGSELAREQGHRHDTRQETRRPERNSLADTRHPTRRQVQLSGDLSLETEPSQPHSVWGTSHSTAPHTVLHLTQYCTSHSTAPHTVLHLTQYCTSHSTAVYITSIHAQREHFHGMYVLQY